MLPHGTGKDVRVAVFAEGEKAREAEEAGADSSAPPTSPTKIEERLRRLRRRDRDARPDGHRRQARPRPRPARADAEPEDGHGHLRRRARPSATRRPASSSTAPTAARTSTSRSARRASTSARCSRTTPRSSRRSSARSRPPRRAATSSTITLTTTMGPGIHVDPTQHPRHRRGARGGSCSPRPSFSVTRARRRRQPAAAHAAEDRPRWAQEARPALCSEPASVRARSFQEEMTMLKSDKERVVAELTERLRSTETLIVADYRGLTNARARRRCATQLLEHGARFTVVKNTLTRRAAEAGRRGRAARAARGPDRDRVRRGRRRPGRGREGARATRRRRRRSSRSAAGMLEGEPIDGRRGRGAREAAAGRRAARPARRRDRRAADAASSACSPRRSATSSG